MSTQPHPVPGRPAVTLFSNARCWQTKARDRLAWWLFAKVAHNDVAGVVRRNYVNSRDATETKWTFGEGADTASEHVAGLGRDAEQTPEHRTGDTTRA